MPVKKDTLPVHAIREPELADKGFRLPKIPKKTDIPPVQISMAEIVEETDKLIRQKAEETIDEESAPEQQEKEIPELNENNVRLSFQLFADKQKVSLVSLIKLLIPEISGKQITVTMTRQQEELIGELKIDWQAWLKEYFSDNEITLLFKIDEKAYAQKRAYTASEQFDELLNENELFRKMVNQFKLKIKM